MTQIHPYYPLGGEIPGYVANQMSTIEILSYFVVGCSFILAVSRYFVLLQNPRISTMELATAMWFVLSGCIHMGMEGYMVWNNETLAGQSTVLGEAWKEYSLSDSRYLTRDTFTVAMEAVTAIFWGPLCILIAHCIATEHPLRHALQPLVSLGQIYGDVLYFATCWFEHTAKDTIYGRPENYYFYGYFVLLNAFWIIIPFPLMISSVLETKRAFAQLKAARPKKE